MQTQLIAGDTLNYRVTVRSYPSSEGWVLKFRLVPRSGVGTAILLTAPASDDDTYLVQAQTGITAAWAPGQYGWASWVENNGGERYTIEAGQLEVLPDPATTAVGIDSRSLPRRTLEDLIKARAEWAVSQGRTRSYKIADRERVFASAAELDQELRYWEGQVAAEDSALRLAKGLRPKNRILTRFVRPR